VNNRLLLKTVLEHVPYCFSKPIVAVPYEWRLGPCYQRTCRLISEFDRWTPGERRRFEFDKLKEILEHAYASVPFYRRLYRSHAYHPDRFRSIDHFNDVPVVTKEALREWELTDRSVDERGALLRNTGGTSGEPLAFYIDREAFAREWAHMHAIWRSAGYQPSDLKLTLRGKNLGSQVLRYNVVHNEYVVNSYAKYDQVIAKLRSLVRSKQIAWIHGYPSLVAELSTVLQQEDSETLARIQQSLKGVCLAQNIRHPVSKKPSSNCCLQMLCRGTDKVRWSCLLRRPHHIPTGLLGVTGTQKSCQRTATPVGLSGRRSGIGLRRSFVTIRVIWLTVKS
jgi:phenylacetate-CoA ligase